MNKRMLTMISLLLVFVFNVMADYNWDQLKRFTITGGAAPQIEIVPQDGTAYTPVAIDNTRFSEYMMMALQNCRQAHHIKYYPDDGGFRKYQFACFTAVGDTYNPYNRSNAHSYTLCIGVTGDKVGIIRLEIKLNKTLDNVHSTATESDLNTYYIELRSSSSSYEKTRFEYILSTVSGYKIDVLDNDRWVTISNAESDGNFMNGEIHFYSDGN